MNKDNKYIVAIFVGIFLILLSILFGVLGSITLGNMYGEDVGVLAFLIYFFS